MVPGKISKHPMEGQKRLRNSGETAGNPERKEPGMGTESLEKIPVF